MVIWYVCTNIVKRPVLNKSISDKTQTTDEMFVYTCSIDYLIYRLYTCRPTVRIISHCHGVDVKTNGLGFANRQYVPEFKYITTKSLYKKLDEQKAQAALQDLGECDVN